MEQQPLQPWMGQPPGMHPNPQVMAPMAHMGGYYYPPAHQPMAQAPHMPAHEVKPQKPLEAAAAKPQLINVDEPKIIDETQDSKKLL
jgi:hypothetical protein